ncbi:MULTISPECIES: phosphopantetheine-binding protein [unclassified Acinetobacter]|uniref:phosphopantetheine-binding protein n=1 Tax=unclassified Acinetobacter TaxID=196816 RepID=UPI002934E76E|nr:MULTISPECIES: phosphopantetheine-binding protein [unclassified Acinetobacter]WOE32014.1 phosphopantetheine-binding protein [Acinetobacter sp. SAAs470]WOE37482.1 phosphopantetheine-binding protein [Acinetobacter sp. SAAs474]
MFYTLPKKIQLEASQAKWTLQSHQSLLVVLGLEALMLLPEWEKSEIYQNITKIIRKAKALDIPFIELKDHQDMTAMMRLGEQSNLRHQFILAGYITPQTKYLLDYFAAMTSSIAVVNDAIYVQHLAQHVQWIYTISHQKYHHLNCYTLMRLWSLSAPKHLILSHKGIVLAIAEHLNLEPLEIDPNINLRLLGLDSVAMVSLVGLWRANGADIDYDNFQQHCSVNQLLQILLLQ